MARIHPRRAADLRPRQARASYEDVLKKIVEIPSVSVEPERKARRAPRAPSTRSRCSSRSERRRSLYETKGHPIVYGRFDRGADLPDRHRLQPPRRPAGRRPRLEHRRRSTSSARATATAAAARPTTRGPAMTALFGARYALEQDVPLNIHFLWELEEEIGSPHFETTIRPNAKEFATDSVVVSDTVWVSRAAPGLPGGPARACRASASSSRRARPTSTPARPAARRAIRSPSSAS